MSELRKIGPPESPRRQPLRMASRPAHETEGGERRQTENRYFGKKPVGNNSARVGCIQQFNDPPTLFRFGSVASRIEASDKGEPIIKPLKFDMLRHHLARAATWIEWTKAGDDLREKNTAPPKDIVADVQATPDQPLPVLSRVVQAPVYAPDGTLQTTPGYHAASQTYYAPAEGSACRRCRSNRKEWTWKRHEFGSSTNCSETFRSAAAGNPSTC